MGSLKATDCIEPDRRAEEVSNLLASVQALLVPFISRAGDERIEPGSQPSTLVEQIAPEDLIQRLNFNLPDHGKGTCGLLDILRPLLRYSVNTWHQGFLDKLTASTNAVGVASDLILSVLNTNLHVYHTSPALTVVEKLTGQKLASLFGFNGPMAGGISQPGGSASNLTSLVIARGALYPQTKISGNGGYKFVIFSSQEAHYSIEKAATICGLGSQAVWQVPVDSHGCMVTAQLELMIRQAREQGYTPLYVNATAGTTVLGAFDPLNAIADICEREGLWMHVDASWGGGVAFSRRYRHKLEGASRANSITTNPHKMLGVPITCSFLLAKDMRTFRRSNTLPAGYLFHNSGTVEDESWDLGDYTLQCGRRGDSLKLALGWIYYGYDGYEAYVNNGFERAEQLASLVHAVPDLILVSDFPTPCLQVCFYYAAGGRSTFDARTPAQNTQVTALISKGLVDLGFMVDYAPGPRGSFLRIVMNGNTQPHTVEKLVAGILQVGKRLELAEAANTLPLKDHLIHHEDTDLVAVVD